MAQVSLRSRRQALLDDTTLTGPEFCRAFALAVDAWLSSVADRASEGNPRRLALLAVGGYGRGELCPYSDLDLVLVHTRRRDVVSVANAIWYPVWDEGVHLDHSVRRPREVLDAAREDLRVAVGLLDARLVWGEEKVFAPLQARIADEWRSGLGARWLPTLAEQMAERHRAQGDVAFLLEPDLKESHGGLRDVHVLRAVAAYAPRLSDHVDLRSLDPASAVLTRARVELHRIAGRELDRLLLQDQDQVARNLSFADADALMRAISEAGRAIAWVSDDAWRRRRLWQPQPPRRGRARGRRRGSPEDRPGMEVRPWPGDPGVLVAGGEVALSAEAPVATDPTLPLRLAGAAAAEGLPIARASLRRLAAEAPAMPDPWPEGAHVLLERVLATGRPAIEALESIDHEGLLVRLLPEWQAVRNRPQRNAYHRFTVDRHLLETASNAATLVDRVQRPDLLLVGALLHDIGKGFPGDHTTVGIELVGRIAERMGYAEPDVHTLQTLVRYHLLLPDTATRRDLDDPATIDAVVRAAGDRSTLELLAALTEADSVATGPSAWGPWKAGLVTELTDRAARRLDGDETPTQGWVGELHRRLMAEVRATGRPAVVVDPPRVVVAAPDRPGLLTSVAGTLALHGLDVRSADASSESGVAVEVFTVAEDRPSWPAAGRLREDLDAVLSQRLALEDRLAARARDYAGRRSTRSARPVEPDISISNDASVSCTVVEVRAMNEIGLLHRLTRALFECELDVISARVSTIGNEVVDAFYVRNAGDGKVTDDAVLQRLTMVVAGAMG